MCKRFPGEFQHRDWWLWKQSADPILAIFLGQVSASFSSFPESFQFQLLMTFACQMLFDSIGPSSNRLTAKPTYKNANKLPISNNRPGCEIHPIFGRVFIDSFPFSAIPFGWPSTV